MEKLYRINGRVDLVHRDVRDFARSVECELWQARGSDDSFGVGREARFDIIRTSDNKPLGQLALTQQRRETHLLVTDEPSSERQGTDFDSKAFSDFADSLLVFLRSEGWQIEPVS